MSKAEEIGKLAQLLETKALTPEEFAKLKQEVIDRDDSQGLFLFLPPGGVPADHAP
jgi:hypothetical protein